MNHDVLPLALASEQSLASEYSCERLKNRYSLKERQYATKGASVHPMVASPLHEQSIFEKMQNREDLHLKQFKNTMNKIAKFKYNWASKDNEVRKADGLQQDSKFSLENVIAEARQSQRTSEKEALMLSQIIPCCRKDKSKRDYI